MQNDRHLSEVMQIEIQAIAADFADNVPDLVMENSYFGFTYYTQLVPAILQEVSHYVLPQFRAAGPAWNYLDAASSAITGVNQLLDKTSHRPAATKAKGVVNISSATQLATLSAVNFTLFGGPAFAASFGAGFLLSLDETVRAARRYYDFNYWLDDSFKQLIQTIELTEVVAEEMRVLKEAGQSTVSTWVLQRKQSRLNELQSRRLELEDDIFCRIAARSTAEIEDEHIKKVLKMFTPRDDIGLEVFMGRLNHVWNEGRRRNSAKRHVQTGPLGLDGQEYESNTESFLHDLSQGQPVVNWAEVLTGGPDVGQIDKFLFPRTDSSSLVSSDSLSDLYETDSRLIRSVTPGVNSANSVLVTDYTEKEKAIQAKCRNEFKRAVQDNIVWGLAFTGSLLLCLPGCQLAGLIIMGIAASIYFAKNAKKLQATLKQHSFFKKTDKTVEATPAPAFGARLGVD